MAELVLTGADYYQKVFEIRYLGSAYGQAVQNRIHWAPDQSIAEENLPDLTMKEVAEGFSTLYTDNFLPLQPSNYMLHEVHALLIDSVGDPALAKNTINYSYERRIQVELSGTDAGTSDPCSTFVSAGIRKVTVVSDRAARGSMRLYCLREEDVSENKIKAAKYGAIENAADAYFEEHSIVVTGGNLTCDPVVLGVSKHGLLDPIEEEVAPNLAFVVLGAVVNDFVTSQVSRKQRPAG